MLYVAVKFISPAARASGVARCPPDRTNDVLLGLFTDGVQCVEAEPVEMKFLDPVASISDEKLANWARVRPIEINRVAPFVFSFANEIIVRKNTKIIPIGSEVVVNDVENHAQA